MGTAILAHSSLVKAKEISDGGELYFLIFEKNYESVALLDVLPTENILTIKEDSFWHFVASTFAMLVRIHRLRIDTVIDVERRSVPFLFVQSDIQALPFRTDAFEVVTCIQVFEHVRHPTMALADLARVLADRGTLILTTPNNHLLFTLIWFLWEHLAASTWAHTHVYSLNRRG